MPGKSTNNRVNLKMKIKLRRDANPRRSLFGPSGWWSNVKPRWQSFSGQIIKRLDNGDLVVRTDERVQANQGWGPDFPQDIFMVSRQHGLCVQHGKDRFILPIRNPDWKIQGHVELA